MSVGLAVTKNILDSKAGAVVTQLRDRLNDVQTLKTWLDSQSDAALAALGYSNDEIAQYRSSFTDLDNLRKIAHAQGTQAQANDFFFNAGKLTGLE